jgi:uncharacterized protein YjbI with pentapeptide repeats/energy-coupling factor transporter ATP-binding protein EcfA2
VTPRAALCPGGEPLPIHDQVRRLIETRPGSAVSLVGPHGSGKTAALRHLAATLPPDSPVVLVDDDGNFWTGSHHGGDRLTVVARRDPDSASRGVVLRMARWDTDHLIEYLLATHRDRCASVMARVKDIRAYDADGVAGLWSVVLDAMCEHEALATPAEALRHVLASRLGDERIRRAATDYCLAKVLPPEKQDEPPAHLVAADPVLGRLLAYRPVQLALAAQRVVWDLAAGDGRDHLGARLPMDLVREVATLAAFRAPVMHALRRFACGHDRRAHSTAATILHATDTGWRPEPGSKPSLTSAWLPGAMWAGVDLAGASVASANLSGADLQGAKLDDAAAGEAKLRGTCLRGASLRNVRAIGAHLFGADLSGACADGGHFADAELSAADLSAGSFQKAWFSGANLQSARLIAADFRKARAQAVKLAGADCTGADFRGAHFSGVDLTEAKLSGANFAGAHLIQCDLQNVALHSAAFRDAELCGCDFTASVMPGADFRDAVLRNAGLADVSWEGADLRDADLTGASFHLGSTRSGLVGSTIPCEGSRTGFYTDDYEEQYYRPPEEVRKANLRGADLRGAQVFGTDFYLVDLRGARYSDVQAAHFRRCGAIL